MLWRENLRSIEYRYPDTAENGDYPGPCDFTRDDIDAYTFDLWARRPTVIEGLSILACYEYQTCEHTEWPASEAYSFCDALRHDLIRQLPGYNDAPWEWDENDAYPNGKTTRGEITRII
jgi:hypothetical protein